MIFLCHQWAKVFHDVIGQGAVCVFVIKVTPSMEGINCGPRWRDELHLVTEKRELN